MTLIVAHKHRKLQKSIALTGCAIVLASCGNRPSELISNLLPGNNRPSPLVSEPQPKKTGRTFADWCRQKASLIPEAKHTVEVLLQKAETTDCDAANQKLSSIEELYLNDKTISDIKPLQSLTQVESLGLSDNSISDITPLQSLTNLTSLDLGNNSISDITPLQSLTNLNWLKLYDNKISDIKPLESLTNLISLNLNNNQISDIKSLQSLTKLTEIYLMENPIAPKTCPLKPEYICNWEPQTQP